MKNSIYLIYFFLIVGIVACQKQQTNVPPEMMLAEKIIKANPDSARHLLLSLKPEIDKEDEATQMKYGLMLTKAEANCEIKCTSDSTMLKVVNYYEHHGTNNELMEAYFYLACVYFDNEQIASALDYYYRIVNSDSDDKSTYKMRGLAYNHIGHINMYQDMYKNAMPFFKKSVSYACLAKDSTNIAFFLRDIGRCYDSLNQLNPALSYFSKGAEMAKKVHDNKTYEIIMSELIAVYIEKGQYQKAKEMMLKSQNKYSPTAKGIYLNTMGEIYEKLNQKDSAIYYYKASLKVGHITVHQASAECLYRIYDGLGDYKNAADYAFDLALYTDSIKNMTESQNKSLITSLKNKIGVEKENSRLKVRAALTNTVFSIVSLLVVGAMVMLNFIVRNRKKKYQAQQELLEMALKEQAENSIQAKKENEEKIAEMKQQMDTMSRENDEELQRSLLQVKTELLTKWNEMIENKHEEQQLLEQELEASEVYRLFHQNRLFEVSNEDFSHLRQALDVAYNSFSKRLTDICPSMKEKELRLCMLIKIKIQPKEIGALLNMSPSNISMMRRRLYRKIFCKEGTAEALDEFILGF